jgi:hypothetical protein
MQRRRGVHWQMPTLRNRRNPQHQGYFAAISRPQGTQPPVGQRRVGTDQFRRYGEIGTCGYFFPSAAASAASFARRSALNFAIFSSTPRRWASYSAQAFVPSRAWSCFRLKLASARSLVSCEFDTFTSVCIRIAGHKIGKKCCFSMNQVLRAAMLSAGGGHCMPVHREAANLAQHIPISRESG